MGVEMQWVDGVSAALLQRSPFIGRLWRARQHIIVLQREVAELKQRLEALEQHIADLRRGSSPAEAGPCVELLAESREAPQPQSVLTIPYRDVPIFINSFNRVNCLRQLIQWLQTHGYRRIFVIDNASTYPPCWFTTRRSRRQA